MPSPTLEIKGTVRSGDDHQVGFACIRCDVRLTNPRMISLATIPVFVINIPKRPDDPKEFNILFSFGLDSSNAVHNLIKSMNLGLTDKINFNIQLSGFSTGLIIVLRL